MKLANKNIIYFILITFTGSISLILPRNILYIILFRLLLIIVTFVIYFDKDYRKTFIPDIPNTFFIVGLLMPIIITIIQYSSIFKQYYTALNTFGIIFFIGIIFIIIMRNMNKHFTKKK